MTVYLFAPQKYSYLLDFATEARFQLKFWQIIILLALSQLHVASFFAFTGQLYPLFLLTYLLSLPH